MTGTISYESNNSHGLWWLTDDDWRALETAGWVVEWAKDYDGLVAQCVRDGRFLGAIATAASKVGVESMRAGVAEWEKVTGKRSTDAGCPCCGQPHYFTFTDDTTGERTYGPDVTYTAAWGD